jgi:hypothetical protein
MADGLITVDELREIFDIDPHIGDPRFNKALAAASRRLRTWVGDEAYDDALANDPEDETRQETLQFAEAHLVMHFAVLGINTALRTVGIVRTERVEGNTVLTYHSPREVAELQALYLGQAEQIAGAYLLSDGTVDAFAVLSSSSSQCEGVTRDCGCPVSKCSC